MIDLKWLLGIGNRALGMGHKNNFGFWIADFGLDFNLKSKI
jgi:hypothetical protein